MFNQSREEKRPVINTVLVVLMSFAVITLLVVTPVVAAYYGGDIYTIGLSGSEASQRVGLDGGLASVTFSLIPSSAERITAINLLSEVLGVAIAGAIIFGVLVGFLSRNPIAALIGAFAGFVALAFVQLVVSLL